MLKEILEKINEEKLKKPQIIYDVEKWLKAMGYNFTVEDDKNYKPYKSSTKTGETTLKFDIVGKAKEAMELLQRTKKFKNLYISWGYGSISIDWTYRLESESEI